MIVYPSLFAFIILAAYGFYLVFSLAKDVHYLAISVDSNMTVLASNMQSMSDDMGQMSANVRTMAVGVESMARDVSTLEPMLTSMESMDRAIQSINFSTAVMRDDYVGTQPQCQPPDAFHEFLHALVRPAATVGGWGSAAANRSLER